MNSEALRQYLTRTGITYQKFASIIGTTPGAVAHWLSGRRRVPETVVRLIEYFEDDIQDFYKEEE